MFLDHGVNCSETKMKHDAFSKNINIWIYAYQKQKTAWKNPFNIGAIRLTLNTWKYVTFPWLKDSLSQSYCFIEICFSWVSSNSFYMVIKSTWFSSLSNFLTLRRSVGWRISVSFYIRMTDWFEIWVSISLWHIKCNAVLLLSCDFQKKVGQCLPWFYVLVLLLYLYSALLLTFGRAIDTHDAFNCPDDLLHNRWGHGSSVHRTVRMTPQIIHQLLQKNTTYQLLKEYFHNLFTFRLLKFFTKRRKILGSKK